MQKTTVYKAYEWNWKLSVLLILIISALQHFLYNLAPNFLTGILGPRNESLAEHIKIVFYPTLVWWVITFLVFERPIGINAIRWFIGGCVSIIVVTMLVTMLFCTLIYGLSLPIDSFFIHLTLEIVSIIIAQTVGGHVSNKGKGNKISLVFLSIVVVLLAILISLFSYYPPNLPIFISP